MLKGPGEGFGLLRGEGETCACLSPFDGFVDKDRGEARGVGVEAVNGGGQLGFGPVGDGELEGPVGALNQVGTFVKGCEMATDGIGRDVEQGRGVSDEIRR